jgi:nucleoside-diphosphate-sugar epimerase
LTEALLTDRADVVGVDCFNDNYGRAVKRANLARALQWDAFEFIPLDLARGALDDLLEGVDVVFHLAAEPGVRASWGDRFAIFVRNNILATQHLLEAARGTEGLILVNASSSSVYGQAATYPTREDALPQPFSPYGVTKLAAEHLCLLYNANFGVRSVSLRFFSVYGPRQRPDMAFTRFCVGALLGRALTVFGDGSQLRDFTFVGDVVDAMRLAARKPTAVGGVYNVGGGSAISVNAALSLLGELLQREVAVHYVPIEHGDVARTGADTTRAERDLGFCPSVPIARGLALQLAWAEGVVAGGGRVLEDMLSLT